MRPFKPDMIDTTKLIEQQDINELLVLIEFILCIILMSDNCEKMIKRIM